MSALIGHVRAACVSGDQATISSLQDDYEAVRRSHPSDVRDLHVYGAFGPLRFVARAPTPGRISAVL